MAHSLALLLFATVAAARTEALAHEVHVCCGCGAADASGDTFDDPLNDLHAGQAQLRQHLAKLRRGGLGATATGRDVAVVWIGGLCQDQGTLHFDARDSGLGPDMRVRYASYASHPNSNVKSSVASRVRRALPSYAPPSSDDEHALRTVLTPGVTLTGANFSAITDEDILAQLPANARPFAVALPLKTASGAIPCRTFAAGSAEILPGTLVPTQAELFYSGPNASIATAAPLRLAEWPNVGPDFANPITSPALWPRTVKVNNRTATLTVNVSDHIVSAGWAQQMVNDPGSALVQYYSTWFSDCHWAIEQVNTSAANVSITLGVCANMTVGETHMGPQQAWRAYNLLSELDIPSEYTLNVTAQVMYAWLPDSANNSGDAIIAALSGAGDVIDVTDASNLVFDSLYFNFARGAGIVMTNASSITVSNCSITCVGIMAVNITGGGGNSVENTMIHDTGNGGVYIYSGDRVSLTPGGNVVTQCDVTRVNRYTASYVPAVALNGVGNSVLASHLYNMPHSAVFVSGNNHAVEGNDIHDAVVWAGDSGAIYAGRDTTYRGNVVSGNSFSRILSLTYGVYTLYLDDYMSGWTITNNTFYNTSCNFLGGGRDNTIVNNSFNLTYGSPVKIDARCSGNSSAQYPAILIEFLARVPYNTSAAWINAYPHLPNILEDDPCWPKYNAFIDNTFCGDASSQFASASNATLVSWGSVEWGNTPVACPTPLPQAGDE